MIKLQKRKKNKIIKIRLFEHINKSSLTMTKKNQLFQSYKSKLQDVVKAYLKTKEQAFSFKNKPVNLEDPDI